MIGVFQARNSVELIEKIEGAPISSGSVGTNGAASPNFSTATMDAFVDVEAGDLLYISGDSAVYIVDHVTDPTHLVTTVNITGAHTANAKWKIKRGGVGMVSLLWNSPFLASGERWIVFYETDNFVV